MSRELREGCRIATKIVVDELIENLERKKKHRRKGRVWVRNWISERHAFGASETLLEQLAKGGSETFRNHLRMTKENFEFLLQRLINTTPSVEKNNTRMRDALSPKIKLEVTLRYLATGDSLTSLQYLYRVPKCTTSKFLPEICEAIYAALKDYIKVPNTPEKCKTIIQVFATRWNFPNCGGGMDGKHILLKCPAYSGSEYDNYKGSFSIILLALVDDKYCFEYIDVGANGRASDGGVYAKSTLKNALENNLLHIPADTVFLADDAFPLKEYLLKPYSHHGLLTLKEKVFNYRLSRARRIVENAFGILVSRFRVFEKPIALCPEKVDTIVKATCALHNWLRKTTTNYIPRGSVDEEDIENGSILQGTWRQELAGTGLPDITMSDTPNYSRREAGIRDKFADWFMGEGAVPWQINMINA